MRTIALTALLLLAMASTTAVAQAKELKPQAMFSEPYSLVRGVAELPDGRVFVADQREQAMYLADLTARRKIGGNGSGPKEYQAPVGVFALRGDTAWIHDLRNRRLVAVTPNGVVGPVLTYTSIPEFVDTLKRVYSHDIYQAKANQRLNPRAPDPAVLRWSARGEPSDTLIHLGIFNTSARLHTFLSWDRYAIGLDGRVAVVRNQNEYRVDWVDTRGGVIKGAPIREPRLRVSDADRTRHAENAKAGLVPGGGGGTTADGKPDFNFPELFPYAQSIHISPAGEAWVVRYRHLQDTAPLIDVFDARGTRVRSVTLPAGRRIIGFGRKWLYAIRIDDVGLQWLERYSPT